MTYELRITDPVVTAQKVQVEIVMEPHHPTGNPPVPATPGAAGSDVVAAVEDTVVINNDGKAVMIPLGFKVALPVGFELQVRPRSGLAFKHSVTVANSPGTVDADYRGEVAALMINHGPEPLVVKRGDRIAQIVIAPVWHPQWVQKTELSDTERGAGGFGSTGV